MLFMWIGALVLSLSQGSVRVVAQGPDGWTVYEMNLRASPGGDVIGSVPVNTGMIFEARSADLSWLLGHTQDGAQRGWVASTDLRRRLRCRPTAGLRGTGRCRVCPAACAAR
jgi:hypothetical protein